MTDRWDALVNPDRIDRYGRHVCGRERCVVCARLRRVNELEARLVRQLERVWAERRLAQDAWVAHVEAIAEGRAA